MSCLRIDQIYLFLEGELSSAEVSTIKEHLSLCPKCKKAVEERRMLLRASESLPALETPPDFTRQVMRKIFPKKISLHSLLIAEAAGFSAEALMIFAFFLLTRESLLSIVVGVNHVVRSFMLNFSVVSAKLVKLVYIFAEIILLLFKYISKGFFFLTTVLSADVQIVLIFITLILSFLLLYGVRKIILTGEKA